MAFKIENLSNYIIDEYSGFIFDVSIMDLLVWNRSRTGKMSISYTSFLYITTRHKTMTYIYCINIGCTVLQTVFVCFPDTYFPLFPAY